MGVMAMDAGGDVGISYRRMTPGPSTPELTPEPTPNPVPTPTPTPSPGEPELRATVGVAAVKLGGCCAHVGSK